ncbi:MAG TPA: 4'-phosphopantetheinyl transferase superfamily protein [Pyrinomonadaceae bacterium]|nr:4'-phosphopantetheinyl transferase superfamily protein [Pyrinomonadaceae bacterium]
MDVTTYGQCLWEAAPARPELPRDEVHVWRAPLDAREADATAWRELLAPEERARADRFHFPKDRLHFTVARGLLRRLVGLYTGLAPALLRFTYNDYGKPSLDMGAADDLRFNVSHSKGLALYAFARGREVGVDVEFLKAEFGGEGIAARFFSPAEVAALRALPEADQTRAFFDCWTRKEAYIKAQGQGLSLPLDGFDVSLAPGEGCALLATRHDPAQAARWSLRALAPAPSYAAALAVEGHGWRLRCWRWESLETTAGTTPEHEA